MRRLTKKLLVPHNENNFHPYLLRTSGILFLLLLIVGAFTTSNIYRKFLAENNFLAAVLPGILVELTNSNRSSENVQTLSVSPTLQVIAQMKANDMAEKGYFAHTSPEGLDPWYWFSKAGYKFSYAGENLAVKFDDSEMVNTAWMNSPSHKENILNSNFTEIGIATARGVYEGQETIFVVQMFGSPSQKVSVVPVVTELASIAIPATPEKSPLAITTTEVPPEPIAIPEPEANIIPVASSDVLGAKIKESFQSVKNTSNSKILTVVTPAEKIVPPAPVSKIDRIFSSPSTLLAIFYLILVMLLFIALLFVLLTKHSRRVHNTLTIIILLLIITIFYYGYQTLVLSKIKILDPQITSENKA